LSILAEHGPLMGVEMLRRLCPGMICPADNRLTANPLGPGARTKARGRKVNPVSFSRG